MAENLNVDPALSERFAAAHGIPVAHVWPGDVKGGQSPAIPPKFRGQFVEDVRAGMKVADARKNKKWAPYFKNDRTAQTWINWAKALNGESSSVDPQK